MKQRINSSWNRKNERKTIKKQVKMLLKINGKESENEGAKLLGILEDRLRKWKMIQI